MCHAAMGPILRRAMVDQLGNDVDPLLCSRRMTVGAKLGRVYSGIPDDERHTAVLFTDR